MNFIKDIKNNIDIRDYPKDIISDYESPLENSVRIANYRILSNISDNIKILEIGCGANSFLRNNMLNQRNWYGLDIQKIDGKGRKTIATKIGSVDSIPYPYENFDYIVSNQSIEHWHEYNVNFNESLMEIFRVLKPGGKLFINFPFFLHGHKYFVRGNLDKIKMLFESNNLDISSINLYYDSKNLNYKGWKKCNFPDFYIKRYTNLDSSFVIEVEARKYKNINIIKNNKKRKYVKKNHLSLAFHHGFDVLIWKILRKIKIL